MQKIGEWLASTDSLHGSGNAATLKTDEQVNEAAFSVIMKH